MEVRRFLPTLPPVVHLHLATGGSVMPQTGHGASAETTGLVSFVLDPHWPEGTTRLIERYLRSALFHEFHHLVRGWVKLGGRGRRAFVDGAICEGLATAFERDAAGSMPPWGAYPDDVRAWVAELLQLSPTASYAEWMFRHRDGRRWTGYEAGTYIADCAIEQSGQSAAELAEVPWEEILDMAGFPPPLPAKAGIWLSRK